jgi:hypothetical protein
MIARGLTMAVLVALVMAGTANAQAAKSDDAARPNATIPRDATTATTADGDANGAPATDSSTASTVSDPAMGDAGLPNAPQAKKVIVGYQKPTEKVKAINYLFDAFGPFPIVGSALAAGINQADNSPRDWDQGMRGYGRRWGSDFGIGAITTSTRYGLAELLREDTLYYRCECSGVFPRLRHALLSTFTGRRGEDGHRVFSVPSLVAPYVGELVAVHAWYPQRYDSTDAFRQGNYSLLAYAAGNVVFEFFPNGPHSLLSKFHLQNRRSAPSNSSSD